MGIFFISQNATEVMCEKYRAEEKPCVISSSPLCPVIPSPAVLCCTTFKVQSTWSQENRSWIPICTGYPFAPLLWCYRKLENSWWSSTRQRGDYKRESLGLPAWARYGIPRNASLLSADDELETCSCAVQGTATGWMPACSMGDPLVNFLPRTKYKSH